MPVKIESGKMFGWIDKPSWNPIVGCKHGCNYCWARSLATGRLRNKPRYKKHGFRPQPLFKEELKKSFRNKNIFVSAMGDLFGEWVASESIEKIVETIGKNPTSQFLLLTKNPKRFTKFLSIFPRNVILGTTIETNRNYEVTGRHTTCPPQSRYHRYLSMKELDWPEKFVAIEPLMDFDSKILTNWIEDIAPTRVSISYDNYNNNLIAPNLRKAIEFCRGLGEFTLVLPHGEWIRKTTKCSKCGKITVVEISREPLFRMCLDCDYEESRLSS